MPCDQHLLCPIDRPSPGQCQHSMYNRLETREILSNEARCCCRSDAQDREAQFAAVPCTGRSARARRHSLASLHWRRPARGAGRCRWLDQAQAALEKSSRDARPRTLSAVAQDRPSAGSRFRHSLPASRMTVMGRISPSKSDMGEGRGSAAVAYEPGGTRTFAAGGLRVRSQLAAVRDARPRYQPRRGLMARVTRKARTRAPFRRGS